MAGLLAPKDWPIRKPTDPNQVNGRNINPVRFMEVGGLKGPGVWYKDTGDPQSSSKNVAHVESPTGVKSGRSSTGKDLD
jgi:hypothetical protein